MERGVRRSRCKSLEARLDHCQKRNKKVDVVDVFACSESSQSTTVSPEQRRRLAFVENHLCHRVEDVREIVREGGGVRAGLRIL